jgi:hypothetical protein
MSAARKSERKITSVMDFYSALCYFNLRVEKTGFREGKADRLTFGF